MKIFVFSLAVSLVGGLEIPASPHPLPPMSAFASCGVSVPPTIHHDFAGSSVIH